jgi:sigma-B regulation protein RsbU (phosphoserine phosphatase)
MTSTAARILVVDDHATDRMKMSMAVKNLGHQVDAVGDGRQALDKLCDAAYDLVLLDLWMPVMDGYDLLGEMRSDPELRDVPVIVVSSLDDAESVDRAINLGAEEHLPKPFDLTLLEARILACLKRKEAAPPRA